MTREDIIRMAREAGFILVNLELLERFAALVATHAVSNIDPASSMSWQEGYAAGAAAERNRLEIQFKKIEALMQIREQQPNKPCCLEEREACAKVCEKEMEPYSGFDKESYAGGAALTAAANAIRARGQA